MSGGRRPLRCGTWPSPLGAAEVAAGGLRLSDIRLDGADVLWVEGRPSEEGRCAVVRRDPDGRLEEVLPPGWSARSAVHEYGGGVLAAANGTVHFVNQSDQRVHRVDPGGPPQPLTPGDGLRWGDLEVATAGSGLLAVAEDHRGQPVRNSVAAIGPSGGVVGLLEGADFYAAARPSPDGRRLAWLQWDQPAMPWDAAELWVGDLSAQGVSEARHLAGGPGESIFQPEWSPDGMLHFVGDRTGWWNLHSWDGEAVAAVAPMEAECGRPLWVLGMTTYAFAGTDRIALCACRAGIWQLLLLERAGGGVTEVPLPFTELGHHIRADSRRAVLDAGGPDTPMSVVSVDLGSGSCEILRESSHLQLDSDRRSRFQPVEFPTADGVSGHAFLYPPAPGGLPVDPTELPPLLVRAHGGPTSAASTALDPIVQHWTSRGFAFLDVNYAGSTGYGRAYRERLRGRWGEIDVQDCVDAALHVAGRGLADRQRLLITGGSAGGYVVLCAVTFHSVFAAGASHYGIGDVEALVRDTHKFEARYFDSLIGPYPEERDRYRARSPINHIRRAATPVILFQGLEDAIVPPDQARAMVAALRSRGLPCELLAFEGEQHGFRRRTTIQRVLEAELDFYRRVLGLEPD